MKPAAALITAAWLTAVLPACQAPSGDHRAEFFVFGTRIEIQVRDAVDDNADAAFRALGRDFRRMHREWHPWEPGELTRVNRGLGDGTWVRATPDLVRLLEASQDMERATGGYFNAAIGRLVALWGFHTSDYPITEPPPDPAALQAVLAFRPSTLDVESDGDRMRTRNRAVQLDFSGIAKGLAVEQACRRLAEYRIDDALVNAGGDVLACGYAEPPWRVGVGNPAGGVLTTVELREPMAVFTSGSDQRFGEFDGERYAHILDPWSGQPARGLAQATVVHRDPLIADAAATALIVAGPLAWRRVAEDLGLEFVIVIDAEGRVETTEAVATD